MAREEETSERASKELKRDLLDALEGVLELALELGRTVRSLDPEGAHGGQWTQEGEYISDERFRAAATLLAQIREGFPYTVQPGDLIHAEVPGGKSHTGTIEAITWHGKLADIVWDDGDCTLEVPAERIC
jgi:hypothetical protein